MSSVHRTLTEFDYPGSDGKPMAKTDDHRRCMIDTIDRLQLRYAGQQVYVTGDLLVYTEEGNRSTKRVAPDVFVTKDCEPRTRNCYLLWNEGPPHVVFEFTSKSTKREDQIKKPELYARIGVHELYLFDPQGEYLKPRLQGYRRSAEGVMVRIEPDAAGNLICNELGLLVNWQGAEMTLTDQLTGKRLLTKAEAEHEEKEIERQAKEAALQAKERERQAKEMERQAKERERQAKEAALQAMETERQAAEAERQAKEQERLAKESALADVERLRAELQKLKGE